MEGVQIVSRIPAKKASAVVLARAGDHGDDGKWLDWGCRVTPELTGFSVKWLEGGKTREQTRRTPRFGPEQRGEQWAIHRKCTRMDL